MRVFLLLSLVAALLAPLATIERALASEPPEWGEPVQIGTELPSSWFADIDVDPTGKARAVWSAGLKEGDLNESQELAGAVMISELTDDGWTKPADIFVMHGGIASRPMIASDGRWAHLIFRYADPGVPVHLVYSRAPLGADLSSAHSWSTPREMSIAESYWSQLRVLPDGVLVVLYNQVAAVDVDGVEERRTVLFSRRSTDDGTTWETPQRISTGTEHVARIALTVSPDNQLLLASWDVGYENMSADGEPAGLATAYSTDAGQTWTESFSVSGGFEQSVVETDGERALLVYRSTAADELIYHSSTDGGRSWSDAAQLGEGLARFYPGKHNFDKMSLALDGDGRFLLAWVGTNLRAPEGLSVMVATWDGAEWTPPQIVASPDGFPEYPRLGVSLGAKIQMIYFVRDKMFDVGSYKMWVVEGVSDAQEIAAEAAVPVEPSPTVLTAVPTPELFVRSSNDAIEPTPLTGITIDPHTPQSITQQPMMMIAMFTVGALLAILVVFGLARKVLYF